LNFSPGGVLLNFSTGGGLSFSIAGVNFSTGGGLSPLKGGHWPFRTEKRDISIG